jgi:uncharacterized protein YjbI with pentapeptide repeats
LVRLNVILVSTTFSPFVQQTETAPIIDLSNADLSAAALFNTNLSNANLSGAKVTNEQLQQAKSLKGATMPDGSTHP